MSAETSIDDNSEVSNKPQILENFQQLPSNVQRLIIGLVFLTFLVGIVILKNTINNKIKSSSDESVEVQPDWEEAL